MVVKMKRIFTAYKKLFVILFNESPFLIFATFASAIITGIIFPLNAWLTSEILNKGLLVAAKELTFNQYIPYLVLFVVTAIIPILIGGLFIYSYVERRCALIFRTVYKGKMMQKLKVMRYEHLENDGSMEIIDKACSRAENSVTHLFPMYVYETTQALVATFGILCLFYTVKWWLLLTILIPFIIELFFAQSYSYEIYNELEKYWQKERRYTILGKFLRSREYLQENALFGSADYLIDTYQKRLSKRNREYESYFFRYLKNNFTKQNITRIAQIVNALLLLYFYLNNEISIGLLMSLTLYLFTSLYSWNGLDGCTFLFKSSGYHIQFFDYYEKYFALTDEVHGEIDEIPNDLSIEFNKVYFKYPNTETNVLDGLNFKINHGEKVSIVGENGEGKTTMIKLLLGLFQPDSGEIKVGGVPLNSFSQRVKIELFGPVFQDFVKYNLTLKENVIVGNINSSDDQNLVDEVMKKAGIDEFLDLLENGYDTLLGKDFDGGFDLSGGQWQRIAIARALMKENSILILDEPTSQLDPMVESKIYQEFAKMTKNRTTIFITHRLGSTRITNRILVISNGVIAEEGSHQNLMKQEGLYAKMFNSQKQWYINDNQEVNSFD